MSGVAGTATGYAACRSEKLLPTATPCGVRMNALTWMYETPELPIATLQHPAAALVANALRVLGVRRPGTGDQQAGGFGLGDSHAQPEGCPTAVPAISSSDPFGGTVTVGWSRLGPARRRGRGAEISPALGGQHRTGQHIAVSASAATRIAWRRRRPAVPE